MSNIDEFSVSVHHIRFYEAIDLDGKPVPVSLRGAKCAHGPEAQSVVNDGSGAEVYKYLPALFHLPDGRLFYARYAKDGFQRFRCPFDLPPNGVNLRQLSPDTALVQCQKDQIPFPPRPDVRGESSSTRSESFDSDRPAGAIATSAESSPPRPRHLVASADQADDSPAGRERRVRKCLEENPNATSEAISEATGIPETSVRNMAVWKEYGDERKARRARKTSREMRLTPGILACRPGKDSDPSEPMEEIELLEREFQERATGEQKVKYHKMDAADRPGALLLWKHGEPSGLD